MAKSKPKTKKISVVFAADKAFASRLEQHLTALLESPFDRCETLAEAAKDQTSQVFLALMSPVEALAHHLESASCTEAMGVWKAETKDLVLATRRLRRRLIMVDARALLQEDADVLDALTFDLRTAGSAIEPPALPDVVHLVVAKTLLARDLEASKLVEELEALRSGPEEALPLQEHVEQARKTSHQLQSARAEATNMSEEISLLRENIALQADISKSEQENIQSLTTEIDLLRENIVLQLSAAEKSQSQYAQLEADCTALRKATADRYALKAETDTLKQRLAKLQESNARHEAALDQIQRQDNEALQAAHAHVDRLERELSSAQTEVDELRRELTAVYDSTSWRVTGPMRAVRNFTNGRRH